MPVVARSHYALAALVERVRSVAHSACACGRARPRTRTARRATWRESSWYVFCRVPRLLSASSHEWPAAGYVVPTDFSNRRGNAHGGRMIGCGGGVPPGRQCSGPLTETQLCGPRRTMCSLIAVSKGSSCVNGSSWRSGPPLGRHDAHRMRAYPEVRQGIRLFSSSSWSVASASIGMDRCTVPCCLRHGPITTKLRANARRGQRLRMR